MDIKVPPAFTADATGLQNRFRALGLVILCLSPFIMAGISMYLFLKHAETFYKNPYFVVERRWSQGSVASSLCTTAHPLHTIFTNIIGTSVSETTKRPNLRWSHAARWKFRDCPGPPGAVKRPSRFSMYIGFSIGLCRRAQRA
jgi:hypothetical protein